MIPTTSNKNLEPLLRRKTMESFCAERFGIRPVLAVRAPGRVDLMGSHTDYNQGLVLTVSIDRDTWILAAPRTDRQVRLVSLNVDRSCAFSIDNQCDATGWCRYVQGVALELSAAGYPLVGFDGVVHGTIPISSGLSSSASLESAVATLFEQLGAFCLSSLEKAKLCQQAENRSVGVSCGILDQYSSILGEQGTALLLDCRSLTHRRVPLPSDLVLIICNTHATRQLTGSEYGLRRQQCEQAAAYFSQRDPTIRALRDVDLELFEEHQLHLPEDVRRRSRFIIEENARVLQLARALQEKDHTALRQIGEASYVGARDLFGIGIPAMQAMYDAMSNSPGCVLCRQAGAGFGGCMIALVENDCAEAFCSHVQSRYFRAMNTVPDVFPVQTAPGAGPL